VAAANEALNQIVPAEMVETINEHGADGRRLHRSPAEGSRAGTTGGDEARRMATAARRSVTGEKRDVHPSCSYSTFRLVY